MAAANRYRDFASFVNPNSPMWMGFADQQVNASSPAQDVTFVGGHGIKLTVGADRLDSVAHTN